MPKKPSRKKYTPEPVYPQLSIEEFELENFLMENLPPAKAPTVPAKPDPPEQKEADEAGAVPKPPQSPDEGHRDRLKMRFLQEGMDHFLDHTILELLLIFGLPGEGANALAHRLIERFGSFSQVFRADYEQLLEVPGMTANAAILFRMMPQVSRRYIEQLAPAAGLLDSSEKIGQFLIPKFLGRTEETVLLLCLDNACRLLRCEQIAEGSLSQATFDVRRIAETVFQCKALNIVLAHNHPHGLARPSSQDVRVTQNLHAILKPIGIELLDHFIVSGKEFVSLMELGYLGVKSDLELLR